MRKVSLFSLVAVVPLVFVACGGEDDADGAKGPEVTSIELEEIKFDLEGDRLLSSLTDAEIVTACDELAAGINEADAQIACRIVAAGESDEVGECLEAQEGCLKDPAEALAATDISAAPGVIDCSVFSAELAEGCDYPVSTLLACANALADSVIPSGDAVSCDTAADFSSVEEANDEAKSSQGFDFVATCLDLVECKDLVNALLGGDESNEGGGPNN